VGRANICFELAPGSLRTAYRLTSFCFSAARQLFVGGFSGRIELTESAAQQLFVTRTTIEKHLGKAYLKLGVESREALSAMVGADTPWMT
jgi:hypothetical protein